MQPFKIDDIPKFTDRPGFAGSFVHSGHMSLTHWVIQKGAPLARHSHPHEQITYVVAGLLEFDTPQGKVALGPGEGMVFPGGEEHGGVALETSTVVDVFCPCREDFKAAMEDKAREGRV